MAKTEVLEDWRNCRADLMQTIEGLSERELTNQIVGKEWTVKDILGHISAWNRKLRGVISKGLKEGEPQFDYYPISEEELDEWNGNEVRKRQEYTFKRIQAEFKKEEREITKLIRGLSEDDLTREFSAPWGGRTTSLECIRIIIEHIKDHTETIKSWYT